MIVIAYYLLKVFICSAILFLYYHLALRNKLFHQWNRYYLLVSVVLSLVIPFFKFTIFSDTESARPIQLLQVVYTADEYVANASGNNFFNLSLEQTSYFIYAIVSLTFFTFFILSIFNIRKLIRSHEVQSVDKIKFVETEVKGTPFSFFHFIFWHRSIDIHSSTGQQIFQHELVHVKEKHTVDKIFLQFVLSVFWCNPVFWLIRNELKMIHEFIADKKAVAQADASAFAAMILQAAYPQHSFNQITNQFFQSSIKRRLHMLTKQTTSRLSYASRILALPLIAFLVFAFTIKSKSFTANNIALDKTITVVIDPGHGGLTGARFENIYEDELVLQLAKAIKEVNTNDKIKLVFTRESSANVDLKERVNIAQRNNADLFVSLHMNSHTNENGESERSSGIEVLVPSKNPPYQKQSELLGSALLNELRTVYGNTSQNYQLGKTGVYVVDKNVCPSVLIECGYLTDEKDRSFMSSASNQKLIARQILAAIERFAASKPVTSSESSFVSPSLAEPLSASSNEQPEKTDTSDNPLIYIDGVKKGRLKDLGGLDKLIPASEIKVMYVYKGKEATDKYGKEGPDGVIELVTKNVAPPPPPPAPVPKKPEMNFENALVIIDGEEKGKMKDDDNGKFIPPGEKIKVLNIYKGEDATKLYGKKGENGVLDIITREKGSKSQKQEGEEQQSYQNNIEQPTSNVIFQQAETPAKFPGGEPAWLEYLNRNIN